MGDIDSFAECLKRKLEKGLKEGFILRIYTKDSVTESAAECRKVGLLLEKKGKQAAPFLDLSDVFSEYEQGKSLATAVEELRETIVRCEKDFIWDYEKEKN